MNRLYSTCLILILISLLVPGCSRSRSAEPEETAGGEVPVEEQMRGGNVQSGPSPSRPPEERSRSERPEGRTPKQPVSPAFFALNDRGFSGTIPDVFDCEIGRLQRLIPESLDVCLSSLGGNLPDEHIAPEWRTHLNRQSAYFGGPPSGYRLSAEGEGKGLNTRFKAVWDNRMVIGFVSARIEEDGSYLLEDIGMNSTLEKPYQKMEIPPPLIHGLY